MKTKSKHIGFICSLLVIITILHYLSPWIAHDKYNLAVVFERLYFLPIVLSCLWFDLKGGLISFGAVFLLLIPHLIIHWDGLSAGDVTRMMQILVYLVIAAVLGKTVSNQKREQLKAKHAENLAAIGKSLSAVAHDMKTPLIAIGGFAGLIKKHLPLAHPDRSKADIIIQETARLECMIKNMLDFSRPLELERSEVDVHAMLKECVAIVEEHAKPQKVSVQVRLADDLAPILLDPLRIRQALINLMTNAVHASSEGDSVEIHCYHEGNHLLFDIIDCGCGIPPEIRESVFSPFFTTRKNGTGLGLPIVKKIVEAHEGSLEIIDNPSKGLTFRVSIPT